MFFWFIVIILLCIYKINFRIPFTTIFDDYMSREKTASIKGIFVMLIFMSHIKSYCTSSGVLDDIYITISNMLGQWIVAPFLFYSGYGVMKQFAKKGKDYISEFPRKRILCTLINFDLAVCLFWILQSAWGMKYSAGFILSSLIGWNSLGNSNWYIFAIIILYIFTYFSIKASNGNRYAALCGVVILTTIYAFLMPHWKDTWWYDTVFCYAAGMIFAESEEMWKRKISSFQNYLSTFGVIFVLFVLAFRRGGSVVASELEAVMFVLLIVLVSMKISFDNGILRWLGKHVFSIYILQRLSFLCAEKLKITGQINDTILIGICLACTLLLAYIFDKLVVKVDKIIESI